MKLPQLYCLAAILSLTLSACSSNSNKAAAGGDRGVGGDPGWAGIKNVLVDGSGTVFPITLAMKEEFKKANSTVRLAVGSSGTGVGFERFCVGVIDIAIASRPIKKSEMETCQKNQIEFVELPIALDGISIIVNSTNTWATCLKPEELRKIWESAAEGKIVNWNQVRPDYPDRPFALAGPSHISGTLDYFGEAIGIKEKKIRMDYKSSYEQSVTIESIASDPGGLSPMAFSYYIKNKNVIKALPIENKEGKCVEPSLDTIAKGDYNPFSRPLLIYVNKTALLENPAVKTFAKYHIDPANRSIISESGYVPLPENLLAKIQGRLDNLTTGSIYEGKSPLGVNLADKLASSQKK